MQLLRLVLCIVSIAVAPAAQASGVVVVSSSGASVFWLAVAAWAGLHPPAPPTVSPHHLSVPPPAAKDSCTFVAGVRHCPRAQPR
jgi:hypothetical protein